MNNSMILKQIEVLRLEYSAATEKRKTEIMSEQSKLKTSLVRCSQCSNVLDDNVTSFCSEECRNEYWKPAKKSKVFRSKQELLDGMKELRDSIYGNPTFNEAKKIFI